ncbi:hypothetical protein N9112_00440, partial [bacterium]|nr:hypothetical protein [bacterium]
MNKVLIALVVATLTLTGCSREADVAQRNLAKAADSFEVVRRVVFYNTWKGEYMLAIEGRCSIQNAGHKLSLICKTGPEKLWKHDLGLT